jgi:hypothetical protein
MAPSLDNFLDCRVEKLSAQKRHPVSAGSLHGNEMSSPSKPYRIQGIDFMMTSSLFAGLSDSYSIWLETTNLPGGLNRHANHSKMGLAHPSAGLRKGFVQGHARSLSSSTSIGFLLAGFDADDPYRAKDTKGAFPSRPFSYC